MTTPREEFLARRQRVIGGSDVAPILGMSKYRTAIDVYNEKRGNVDDSGPTARMAMGNFLEEPLIRWYLEENPGCELIEGSRGEFVQHPVLAFLGGNLDGRVRNSFGDQWIVDAKNVHFRALADWGEEDSDDVPLDALLQAHHYLFLCHEAHKVNFIVLRGGAWPPRVHTVTRDDSFYSEQVLPILARFWNEHVLPGIPPAPDFTDDKTLDSIKALYPPTPEKSEPVDLLPMAEVNGRSVPIAQLAEAFVLIREKESELEALKKRMDAALRAHIGPNRSGRAGEAVITRIYNKGGFRPATEIKPYDYLKVTFPKGHQPKLTIAGAQLLIEGETNA